jgi:hypothetical protein
MHTLPQAIGSFSVKSGSKSLPASAAPIATSPVSSVGQSQPHLAFLKRPAQGQKLRVVVIHGDPSKPNDILPGGKWDEDDFYTIQRAKEAMSELQDKYEFTWLCNHDTLMDDLRHLKQQNKVDVVLQVLIRSYPCEF